MDILYFTKRALWLTVEISAPFLISTVLVGILISLVQAAMQLQDQTLPFALKVFSVSTLLFITSSWISTGLVNFTIESFNLVSLPRL